MSCIKPGSDYTHSIKYAVILGLKSETMSSIRRIKHSGYTSCNKVQFVRGGKDYFSLLTRLIDKALYSVHLQFYIFTDDETGKDVIESLKNAAARGVQVFLHLDGFASQHLHEKTIYDILYSGIKLKWFEPLFRSKHFYFGRRLHHKVVVVDGFHALVGGINVCDRYNDLPDEPAWLDMAAYVQGETAALLQKICMQMWGERKRLSSAEIKWQQAQSEQIHHNERVQVRIRRNDWVKRKKEVWNSYLAMFNHAEDHMTIMCSYFLPGRFFRKRLALAAKKGVAVRVILAGRSDISMAKHAERYLYDWLLRNNIEIYEYQDTVLHAKMASYDSVWTTIGSYNVNNISAYASLELNLDIKDHEAAHEAEQIMNDIIKKHCKRITKENNPASKNIFRRIWQRFCYSFINNTLNVFTFYFKQE